MASNDLLLRITGDSSSAEKALQRAEMAQRKYDDAVNKARSEMDADIAAKSANQQKALAGVGTAMIGVGIAAATGVGAAVMAYANFDQAMSNVQAATHATAATMDELSQAAMDAGAGTAFSAVEAAAGIEELAKAGMTAADIMGGGLAGALDLAAAGGMEVAAAAELTATALSVFNLAGSEASHVADLLAAGAGKAQGTVADIGAALGQSALVANQFGLSIEETTGTLAMFASEGLIGSDAGTSFKTMLLSLTNPSKEAATAMGELGINVYDANGQFVGMESIAGQLQGSMSGLDEATRNAALGTIFGSDAIRAAGILYSGGAAGVAEWTAAVDDSGYAAETAAARMDNLKGDMEKLSGAFETALIGLGSSADGPLRSVVQSLTSVVDAFAGLPPAAQSAVMGTGALVAGVGLLGGGLLVLLPKIAATKAAMVTLGVTARGTAAAMGTVGAVAGIAVGAFMAMEALDPALPVEKLNDSLTELGSSGGKSIGVFTELNAGLFGTVDSAADLGEVLHDASGEMNNWWDAADSLAGTSALEQIKGIDAAMAAMDPEEGAAAFAVWADSADAAGMSTEKLSELFPQYLSGVEGAADASAELASSTDEAAAAQESAGSAVEELGASLESQMEAVDALTSAWEELNGIHMGAAEAESAYQQSLDDTIALVGELAGAVDAEGNAIDVTGMSVAEIVDKYGQLEGVLNANKTGFDLTAQAGRDLQASLFGTAESAATAAVKTRDLAVANGSDLPSANQAMIASLDSQRSGLSQTMQSLGMTKADADALSLSVIGIPDESLTSIGTPGMPASQTGVRTLTTLIRGVPTQTNVTVTATTMGAASVEYLQRSIANINSKTVTITVNNVTRYIRVGTPGGSGGVTEFAIGGIATRATSALIGEAGPEAVIPLGRLDNYLNSAYAAGSAASRGSAAGTTSWQSGMGGGASVTDVRVFIGQRELTDIVDVQVDGANRRTARRVGARVGALA